MKVIMKEMAYPLSKALMICQGYGRQFITHYAKLPEDTDELRHHHISEMQSWWDEVRNLRLKMNNKVISNQYLIDSFFTVGADIEDFLDEPYSDSYNKLMIKMLDDRDKSLSSILDDSWRY